MIKTKNGETKLKGNIVELQADLVAIIVTMRKMLSENDMAQEAADEFIRIAFQAGFMSIEEIIREIKKNRRRNQILR